LAAVGVQTTFRVCAVLKGDKALKRFTLHHFRDARPDPHELNGPGVVTFDPARGGEATFLLFLVRERDGRYAPYGGQTDPGAQSVFAVSAAAWNCSV
jgi:hypothetical protein